jgi:hypothetical protein
MIAWNASTVITLVAELWERHQQLPCLAGSASFSVEDFGTRNGSKPVSITVEYIIGNPVRMQELEMKCCFGLRRSSD